MRTAALLVECVLRGFGQFFLANCAASGLLFLLGLSLVSPLHAGLGLLGAGTVTCAAFGLGTSPAKLRTGLFGVNGALLGCGWLSFPELSPLEKVLFTLAGSLVIAAMLVPLTKYFARRRLPLTVFALPYVLIAWTGIAALHWSGMYDRRCLAAWSALTAGHARQAAADFKAARPTSPRADGLREDGLGWAAFQESEFAAAREHFRRAAALLPELADPYDGLGWSSVRLGDFEPAEAAFRAALTRDTWVADSWNGLGWTLVESGDEAEAADCFCSAARAAPLLADAYSGLARTLALDGQERAAVVCRFMAEAIQRHVSTRFQYTPSAQIACWLLFLAGIVYHSRISAAVAGATLVACLAGACFAPALATGLADMNCVYNLLALTLALGGHYLRLRLGTLIWTAAVGAGMVLAVARLSAPMTEWGLPPLCLPCSFVLAATLAAVQVLQSLRLKSIAVPLEVAVTSPENVRLWDIKCRIAKQCWKQLMAEGHKRSVDSASITIEANRNSL